MEILTRSKKHSALAQKHKKILDLSSVVRLLKCPSRQGERTQPLFLPGNKIFKRDALPLKAIDGVRFIRVAHGKSHHHFLILGDGK